MNLFRSLFVGLVRPHPEYANFLWAPFFKKDTKTIEKVKRRGTRMTPELRHLDYEYRLKRLNLQSHEALCLNTEIMIIITVNPM